MNYENIFTGFFWAVYNELLPNTKRIHVMIRSSDDFIKRNPFVVPYLTKSDTSDYLVINLSHAATKSLRVEDGFMYVELSFSKIMRAMKIDLFEIEQIGDPDTGNYIDFNCLMSLTANGYAILSALPKHMRQGQNQEQKVSEKRSRAHLTVVK